MVKSKRFQFSWQRYKHLPAKHNGKFIEIQPPPTSKFTMEGKEYVVSRIDVHSPSEHWINGQYGDTEIQFVSKSSSGASVVHSVIYAIDPKASSSSFLDGMKRLPKKAGKQTFVDVDLPNLLGKVDKFEKRWEYTGTMTIPPCESNVQWFIASDFVPSKLSTLDPITIATGFSARPIQRFD